jgi:hypothetical protein
MLVNHLEEWGAGNPMVYPQNPMLGLRIGISDVEIMTYNYPTI